MANLNDTDFSELDISDGEDTAPAPDYHKQKSKRSGKKQWKWLLIIVVMVAVGLIGWKLTQHNKKIPSPVATQSKSKASSDDVPTDPTTKSYTSENYNLTFSYPSNWTLSTATDSSIRIVSPGFTYKTVTGQSVTGNFRVNIRQTARAVDSKYIGRGVAVEPSQSLTYAKPAPTQRQTTYLTNFGLDTSDNFAFFLIAGNFNLKKGDTLGPTYGTELGTDIISGGYSANTLTDDMNTNQVPLSYYAHTTAYKEAIDIIKSLVLR